MSRRRRQRGSAGQKLLPGLLAAAGVGGMVALISLGSVPPARHERKQPVPETHTALPKPPTAAPFPAAPFGVLGKQLPAEEQPRRVPVAGSDGYTVVLNPDGTSYLEGPDGKKTQLVDRTFARTPSEKELEERIRKRLQRPAPAPRKAAVGQLVVLDEGVVDVPRDALITYTGPDRLVALTPDGTATVYWADGRTEIRDRQRPAPARVPTRKLPDEK